MIAVAVIGLALLVVYLYGTRNHNYWQKRGVKHDRPLPFFGTNARRYLLLSSMTEMATHTYWNYPKERIVGYYRGSVPELVVRDPDIIRQLILNDFSHFYSRGLSPKHGVIEPLLRNLFFADGDMWRLLRQRMTPAFTSSKLKAMFPLIVERAEKLQARTVKLAALGEPLDARDLMARYTTDFIGACGFGLDTDCLTEQNSAFLELGKKIFNPSLNRAIGSILKSTFPDLFKHYKFLGQQIEDEVIHLVNSIKKQRNFTPSGRNDFIDLLLELQQRGKIVVDSLEKVKPDGSSKTVELTMDDHLVAAQAFIFFTAGFETSSSATSATVHQLAYHPEVQEKVQKEIDRVLTKYDNKLCYDAINEMTYLEWAFLEGMRIFPSSGLLMRRCTRKYTISGTGVTIDKGVKVVIPLQALHNDAQYFDNPSEFRPERHSPEEAAKRHKYVFLPFGGGPRACIGERLGMMQSLAGLAALLSRFSVTPAGTTARRLRPDPRSTIVQNVLGGIPLRFHLRERNL